MELRRLESTEDVTTKVRSAVKSKDDTLANQERNVAIAALENECKAKTGQRCEMVTLYRGAAYQLYRYKTWDDVRLVFAPEARIGFFGVIRTTSYTRASISILRWCASTSRANRSSRRATCGGRGPASAKASWSSRQGTLTPRIAWSRWRSFAFDRDVRYPLMLASAKRRRKELQAYSARSPEAERRAAENLLAPKTG